MVHHIQCMQGPVRSSVFNYSILSPGAAALACLITRAFSSVGYPGREPLRNNIYRIRNHIVYYTILYKYI